MHACAVLSSRHAPYLVTGSKEPLMSQAVTQAPAASAGDKRYKILDTAIKRHQAQPDALLEVLHSAQELFGFLEDGLLAHIGHTLRVPLSRVYGVATFYNFFRLKPAGKHTCVVCMGTACYVKGAGEILGAIEKEHGLRAGGTTSDGKISLITARCVGSCGLAPAVVFDNAVEGRLSSGSVLNRLGEWSNER
jgi:bidirectional [NiFe] hydrogenase diaphorase subunit